MPAFVFTVISSKFKISQRHLLHDDLFVFKKMFTGRGGEGGKAAAEEKKS
jgi:hypothetical protein